MQLLPRRSRPAARRAPDWEPASVRDWPEPRPEVLLATDLVTLTSCTYALAHRHPLSADRCLVCSKPIGATRVRVVALVSAADPGPAAPGLRCSSWLVHDWHWPLDQRLLRQAAARRLGIILHPGWLP